MLFRSRRMIEGVDRDYLIWVTESFSSVIFNTGTELMDGDVYTTDYLVIPYEERVYYNSVVTSGVVASTFGINKGIGLQVFRDGLHLRELDDYTIQDSSGDKLLTLVEPLDVEETLELNYYSPPIAYAPHRVDSTRNFEARVEVSGDGVTVLRSTIRVALTGLDPLPQMVMFYKNGVRLSFGALYDYTKVVESDTTYIEYELSPLDRKSVV